MSRKRTSLQAVLSSPKDSPAELQAKKTSKKELQKVKVIYSIPSTAKKQFDRLALDLDKTKQDAFREALNDFFKKYGKPEIA